jgi:hypothetical protein
VQELARLDMETGGVGCRVQGTVLLVRVAPVTIFMNCPRYIPRYAKVEA